MHDCPIPYAAKQSVGDTRCTPRTHGKLMRSAVLEMDAEHSRRSFDKLFKLLMRIKVEMRGETETSPQRRWQHAFTSGGTDHRKPRQSKRNGGSARSFADHYVNTKILHGYIQQFLGRTWKAMDLVDEEHFPGIQRTQNGSQIAGMLNGRTGSDSDRHSKLVGNNHSQRGLAQARRPRQKNMIWRNVALAGSIQK